MDKQGCWSGALENTCDMQLLGSRLEEPIVTLGAPRAAWGTPGALAPPGSTWWGAGRGSDPRSGHDLPGSQTRPAWPGRRRQPVVWEGKLGPCVTLRRKLAATSP